MNARLWKEGRALFPYWAAAMLVSLLCVTMTGAPGLWILLAVLGESVLGAVGFGHEYAHGTMPMLLSQPLSRRRIWYEKMGVLGAALFSVAVATVIVPFFTIQNLIQVPPAGVLVLLGFPVLILLTGPALTLLLKNTLAAALFAPLLPIALGWILWLLATLLIPDQTAELTPDEALLTYFVAPVGMYVAAMYLVGCYRFAGLESRESQPRDLEWSWFKLSRRRPSPGAESARMSPWVALISKELHLQKLSFVLAIILIAACLSLAGYRRLHPEGFDPFVYWSPFLLYWLIAPITIGAISIAEEKQLGLLEWQLTLPPARWKQWAIKLTVTFFTAVMLLAVLPAAMLFGIYEPAGISLGDARWLMVGAGLGVSGLLSLAIFASSLSSHTLRATLATIGILAGGAAIRHMLPDFDSAPLAGIRILLAQMASSLDLITIGGGGLLASLLLVIVLALALSRANYLANDARRPLVWLQWALVTTSTGLLLTLIGLAVRIVDTLHVQF